MRIRIIYLDQFRPLFIGQLPGFLVYRKPSFTDFGGINDYILAINREKFAAYCSSRGGLRCFDAPYPHAAVLAGDASNSRRGRAGKRGTKTSLAYYRVTGNPRVLDRRKRTTGVPSRCVVVASRADCTGCPFAALDPRVDGTSLKNCANPARSCSPR